MATFTRSITKHEFNNHCIMLQDKAGKDYRPLIKGSKVEVRSEGKTYFAEICEYYIDGKFLSGLHFDPKREDSDDFYYEQGVTQGHHAEVTIDENCDPGPDGLCPVDITMSVKTK